MARNSTYSKGEFAPSSFPSQSDSVASLSDLTNESRHSAIPQRSVSRSRAAARKQAEIIDFDRLASERRLSSDNRRVSRPVNGDGERRSSRACDGTFGTRASSAQKRPSAGSSGSAGGRRVGGRSAGSEWHFVTSDSPSVRDGRSFADARGRRIAPEGPRPSERREFSAREARGFDRTRADSAAQYDDTGGRISDEDCREEEERPSRWEKLCRLYRHRKADRTFEKTIGFQESAPAEDAPRAGLYKGEMGPTARKSARMQQRDAAQTRTKRAACRSSRGTGRLWSALSARIGIVVAACLALSLAFVYPAAQDYYLAIRTQDQATAEYEAVTARNEEIQDRIDVLNTDEGIEDLARSEYGYVMSGETAVNVDGLDSDEILADATEQTASVASGSVEAPETWYSPILDAVFGYSND